MMSKDSDVERAYRLAVVAALVGVLLLGWMSGAVGIIGSENNPANLMYFGVVGVGIIGVLFSRLKPRGLSYALFATALAQFLVPVIALVISPNVSWGGAGVFGVFLFNFFFVMVFALSGFLFRRAYSLVR